MVRTASKRESANLVSLRLAHDTVQARAQIKKEAKFSDRFVYDRLKNEDGEIEWFRIEANEEIREYTFPRYYFSSRFGGGPVMTFPVIAPKKLREHGIDNWAFLSTEMNPHAPTLPGAPGLFFRPYVDRPPPADKRLFVRLRHNRWLYCGTYRFTTARSLTSGEWMEQSETVRCECGCHQRIIL